MSRGTSLQNAKEALRQWPTGKVFRLMCNCGWVVRENRPHLLDRVRAHFAYPDAHKSEEIEIAVEE